MKQVNKNSEKGVSMVEVLVASLIFSIAAVSTFSILMTRRESSTSYDRRLQAAQYGRQLLDELHAKVEQNAWNSGWYLNCDNTYRPWPVNMVTTNPFFSVFNGRALYNCIDNPTETSPVTGLRKVNLNIVWDEP